MSAMRRWTEALHPRIGGKFAPKGSAAGRRFIVERDIENLGPRQYDSGLKRRRGESEVRRRMREVQHAVALASGKRQPRNFSEELDLQWASPRKRAEQFAKTGNYQVPRAENIRRLADYTRTEQFGKQRPRVVTKRKANGRVHVTRGYGIPGTEREYADAEGHQRSIYRPRNLAGKGPAASKMHQAAQRRTATDARTADLERELKGLRRNGLAQVAARYGLTISAIDTNARTREKILAAARKR